MNSNKINFESLRLDIDFPFLAVPNLSTQGVDGRKITVNAKVQDIYGNSLPNISIFVSDSISGNLKNVKIYGSDQNKEITPVKQDGREGFSIETDKCGDILFFIHPHQSLPVVLNLYTNIVDSTRLMPAKHKIFIVNNSLDSMKIKFDMPEIINFWGEYLKSDGSAKFEIDIPHYPGKTLGDYILFFVNGEYTKYFIRVDNNNDSSTSTEIPYDIFTKNVYSNFFYVIIRGFGNILEEKSASLPLTYKGGVIYKPVPVVERNYAACIVYTSLGTESDAIIPNDSSINYAAIMQYPGGQKKGLYVEILGTQDPNREKDKVPLNIPVILKLYLNSIDKSYAKIYPGKIKVRPSGRTSAVIHIPFDDVKDVKLYQDGGVGYIYFDYTFYDGNDQYGEIWSAEIETDDD
ncbi:hypothetical protein ACR71G_04725 [Xenorhabdus bovienii]|uniref:hypothetical protein n=1 Tax=Xenorhabdus bovienii TaxID=40576 RepID=UPI003DA2BBBD